MQITILKGNQDMPSLTSAVNNDFIAAEAKYHRACHASFAHVNKTNVNVSGVSEDTTFIDLIEEISRNLRSGKAYDMSKLMDKFRDHLCGKRLKKVDGYITQRLRNV